MGGFFGGDGYVDPEDEEELERALERREKGMRATPFGDGSKDLGEERADEVKSMARSHAELAMKTLADVMENATKDAPRVAAAKEVLARGFGGVTRRVEQKVDVKIQDQRAAHYAALRDMAERNPVVQIEDAEFSEVPSSRQISKRRIDDEGD